MAHTHENGAIARAFPTEHAGLILVTLRRKMAELEIFEDFFIPIFMNFKLNINYDVILSKI